MKTSQATSHFQDRFFEEKRYNFISTHHSFSFLPPPPSKKRRNGREIYVFVFSLPQNSRQYNKFLYFLPPPPQVVKIKKFLFALSHLMHRTCRMF